jgi:hypothetical protein
MAETVTPSSELDAFFERPEFQSALSQWPSNPTAGLAQLRPLADAGDLGANIFLAWMYPHVGPWNEGVPYARRAADAGVAPGFNYVANMAGDPSMDSDFLRFIALLIDAGWPMPSDPLAWVHQMLTQSRFEAARALMQILVQHPPSGARRQLEELLATAMPAVENIRGSVEQVRSTADESVEQIGADVERVGAERQRAENLVKEVGDLANEGASRHLAKEYAAQAKQEEDAANRYTTAAIWLGAGAVLVTAFIAYLAFTHEHGTGAVLTKAALVLPIVAFVAYIGGLGRTHRRQAWRWRHIELQIRTANPFVSPLEDEQRRLLIAALALRFFPGQRHDVEGDAGGETVDPVAFLAQLFPGLASTKAPVAPPASTEPQQPQP